MTPAIHWGLLVPEVVIAVTLAVVFIVDLLLPDHRRNVLTGITILGLVAAFGAVLAVAMDSDRPSSMLHGSYVVDSLGLVAKALFVASTAVVLMLGVPHRWKGEYLVLVLSSVLGMMLVVSARDLILFFVAFELFAIPGYLLSGWRKNSRLGHEGLLKYYLLGVLATAVMLYGISLLFGLAGGTSFAAVDLALQDGGSSIALVRISLLFVIVGLAFKVSAVPFHFWAPDAYQSAPLPVAAFLSVSTKAAGIFSLLSLCINAFGSAANVWAPLMVVLSVATMTVGNVAALRQNDLVRLLAYSSISQAGYLLLPLAVAVEYGGSVSSAYMATVDYIAIYAVTNIAAFAGVIAVAHQRGGTSYESARGLFGTSPALATLFSVALFSLAGMPPFGGWFAKLVVFKSAIDANSHVAFALVIVAAINTAIGLVYYANVVRQLWMPRGESAQHLDSLRAPLVVVLGLTTFAIGVTGVVPSVITQLGNWVSTVG